MKVAHGNTMIQQRKGYIQSTHEQPELHNSLDLDPH